MQIVADDPVNLSIWTESVSLQRKIVGNAAPPLQVGAQQAMPKACDQASFTHKSPLPWVPDLVGSRFGSDRRTVLVVASSYNGFIEGYSQRAATLPLVDYVDASRAGVDGLRRFVTRFKECVIDPDEDYYQPILRDLLPRAGCDPDDCCLTDLCKASFVKRGSGPDTGNRGDEGSDSVVQTFWEQWVRYVTCVAEGGCDAPLPYQWLWQRMQQCRVIVALGTIAEYGVLKVYKHMAAPKAWSWRDNHVVPPDLTTTAQASDWSYGYADFRRKMQHWLNSEDWWVLNDSGGRHRWFMLPVHHPAAAIGRGTDPSYSKTVPRVRRMIEEAAARL